MDEKARDCVLPPLMIQTLVENSYKYGKLPERLLEISVTVEVLPEGGLLCINVSDNGRGYPEEYIRIWEQAKVRFYNSPMGGAVAEIRVPMQFQETGQESGQGE